MNFLLINLVALTLSVSTFAADLPEFSGHFKFDSSSLAIQQVRHQIVLVVSSDNAKQYLGELRERGYACSYVVNNHHRCILFVAEKPEDSDVRIGVIKDNESRLLEFETSSEEYSLINEAIALLEFEKYQNSKFDNTAFDKIRFYVTAGLKKFKIYDSKISNSGEHFYMTRDGQIARQIQVSKKNRKTSSFVVEDRNIYLYEGVWKQ